MFGEMRVIYLFMIVYRQQVKELYIIICKFDGNFLCLFMQVAIMLDIEFNENVKRLVFFVTQIGFEDKSLFDNISSNLEYEDPLKGFAGKIAE